MRIEKLLVDSNVLLRLSDLSSPQHPICRQAMLECIRKGIPLTVCTQILIEFWSVSTRPLDVNGLNRTMDDTYQSCLDILNFALFLPEPEDIFDRWLDLVHRYEVRGKQVHDARLVAFA
ncbi:MAG: PIN domain nuclease [Chthonomonadetes bacterium]|nr:PIN domain nuclease [Chthonomonadetes bacterium]